MATYDYRCNDCGELTEKRWQGVEDYDASCRHCGGTAKRVEVYQEQYTRTDSGGMQGRMGKAGTLSEQAERIARNSEAIEKETGQKSGPRLR